MYLGEDLTPIGYKNSEFLHDTDFKKLMSNSIFTLGGGAIIWRSVKQSCIVDSTIKMNMLLLMRMLKQLFCFRNY